MTSPYGMLYSQIGYDSGWLLRAIYRGPAGALPDGAGFAVIDAGTGRAVLRGATEPWGEQWGSCWWVADFSALAEPGSYRLMINTASGLPLESDPFDVAPDLLWSRTWQAVGPDQAERRRRLAADGLGWYDAGTHWQEASSHVAFVAGLCDLLTYRGSMLGAADRRRVETQIVNGCDYLAALQDRAAALGQPGAVVHQIFKFDELLLPGDSAQAAFAWARAARTLPAGDTERRRAYAERAARALDWFLAAQPLGGQGFSRVNHGWPAEQPVPVETPTRELLMACRAAVELALAGDERQRNLAVALAERILARQIPAEHARDGLYGHFRLFDGAHVAEKAWVHNGEGGLGADCGGHWPHDILPLIEMCRAWPDHPRAAAWRGAVCAFAYGYLLPACRANPFQLLPLGQFDGEGLIWFAGLWHGMNAAYGLAAALAWELERFLGDAAFRPIVAGNLQWIAGLNAGLTASSLHAAHMFSRPVPEGVALPVSMINGIGRRYAGSWMNITGAICNGFSLGDQFRFDLPATRVGDGPHSFTDEDWITHAGAWLSATSRLGAQVSNSSTYVIR